MNYLEVYFSRINHLGETATEIALNSNIRSFERWLAGSPFTVENLSVERGLYFSGIIQTSKDKEEKKLMYLYVANDIPIQVGDILTWIQDNGTIEKWILLQKIHDVHEAYQTFQMIKCNYELKWIDEDGYLHKSWAYVLSSKDEMIKGNFRMWHSLISPQPNKYAEIIMPRPELTNDLAKDQLMRGITFIIENEGWEVIECDWTSVEGIIYMSLTESKVNYQYDDRDINVADTDKYKFPMLPTLYRVGDVIIPRFEVETLNQWEIELRPSNFDLVSEEKELPGEKERWYSELHSIAAGQYMVTMRLKNRPAVTQNVEIIVEAQEEESIIYIDGIDEIKLDRYAIYTLIDEITKLPIVLNTNEYIKFSSQNKKEDEKIALVSLNPAYDKENKIIPQSCVVHANTKNKLGEVTLIFEHKQKVDNDPKNDIILATYTKIIKVIPLW